MSWWWAVPVAVAIVLGAGAAIIAVFMGAGWLLFQVLDRIEERIGRLKMDAAGAVITLIMVLFVFIVFVSMTADWLAA